MTSHGLETGFLAAVVLPLALAVIMLGMGMTLSVQDFRRIRHAPAGVAVGLLAQVLVLPVLAMAIGVAFHRFLGLEPILVLGLLLLACCPGGATSNVVAYLARADAALSVTLTSLNSVMSALSTPFIFLVTTRLVFGDASVVSVNLLEMVGYVTLVVVAPLLLGMAYRARNPVKAFQMERGFRLASSVFLGIVILGVILQNADRFLDLARQSVPVALALNASALLAGLALARAAGLGEPQARAIGIEVGFQNGTLGIALAVSQLGSAEAAIVPGFYSLVAFATGGALAWWWARSSGHAPVAPDAAPTE